MQAVYKRKSRFHPLLDVLPPIRRKRSSGRSYGRHQYVRLECKSFLDARYDRRLALDPGQLRQALSGLRAIDDSNHGSDAIPHQAEPHLAVRARDGVMHEQREAVIRI